MVEEVLEKTGFKEQRAAKMSVDDLLKYYSTFATPHSRHLIASTGCFQHFTTWAFILLDPVFPATVVTLCSAYQNK